MSTILCDCNVVNVSLIAESKPVTMEELDRLVNEYFLYWENIAYELDLSDKIDQIEEKYPDCQERLRKVLEIWYNSNKNPTWDQLEDAISNAIKIMNKEEIAAPSK